MLAKLAIERLQPFFELLHHVSLKGMNYGAANSPRQSGERAVLERLRVAYGESAPVVFDVGANHGQYARLATSVLGSKVQLHCFEPLDAPSRDLASMAAPPRVNVHKLGLSDRVGPRTLRAAAAGDVRASVYELPEFRDPDGAGHTETVEFTTLDTFCAEAGVGRIDFLKIDVEGHELAVLRGARRLLDAGAIGAVQFEFGAAHVHARVFLADFFELLAGFELHRVVQDGIRRLQYAERYEVFHTSNYLALNRSWPVYADI